MKKLMNKGMKDKIYKISFNCILMALITLSISSCASDKKPDNSTKTTIEDSTEVITIREPLETFNEINFYFENSGSMNGYLEGKNFKQTMHRIIDDENPSFKPYFVNTKEYPTSNILSKIDNNNIVTNGTNSSDHQFIFTNAIKNAVGNNLSIVVTDGIYSMPKGGVDIVEVEIEKSFVKALNDNAIETVVLKMASNYKGTYYTESNCENVPIDQERPYYILLFGNKQTIDKALENIVVIERLEGFKQQARFFLTNNLKIDYTVITQGEEKKGSFRKVGAKMHELVKEIEDAERYESLNNKYLQFGIAVDYNNLSIPEQYLVETENYFVDEDTGYDVIEIKPTSNLSSASLSQYSIKQLTSKNIIKPTHIIIVKAERNILGNLKIQLKNKFPTWISVAGQEEDCDIKGNTSQTFAFDKLMTGISKAYEIITKKDEYFEIEIKIKN